MKQTNQILKLKGIKPTNQQTTSQAFSGKVFVGQGIYKQLLQWNLNKEPIYCQINGFIFSMEQCTGFGEQQIGLSKIQRQELKVSLIEEIEISGYKPEIEKEFRLGSVKIELELLQAIQNKVEVEETQVIEMMKKQYKEFFFQPQQLFFLDYQGNSLQMRISSTHLMEIGEVKQMVKFQTSDVAGMLVNETDVQLVVKNNQYFRLRQNEQKMMSIFTDEFNFEKMGIGGLDTELLNIFRRAFASRRFPPHVLEKYGIQHVKGVLLYGPPGTGKTLIARELGKALRAKEPKIVNGPEIMSKYVGEAEERIRKLFEDAISDQKEYGPDSQLHIIIFDELDSICRPRGTINSGTGIHDTMVNQLLSMIDGVNALNNVLVIGMTNRKDLIDEAVLRPGRFEVHIEVLLPDEFGRQQIFKIHTKRIFDNQLVNEDVKLSKLAELTKNYTGAEIEAVVKSAASFAFFRGKDISDFAKTATITENSKISMQDFEKALEEVKPQFGVDQDKFEILVRNNIYNYGQKFAQIQNILESSIEQVKFGKSSQLHTVLLEGENGAGKTAIAASMALQCKFPFVKLVSPENFVGYTENGKINAMVKIFDDAYKSPLSCIIMDNIERLIEFIDIGPRFSNTILQAVLVLLKKVPKTLANRLLIVGTTSSAKILKDLEITQSFNLIVHIPLLTEPSDISFVLKQLLETNSAQQNLQEIDRIAKNIKDIPIKKLMMLVDMAMEGSGQLNYDKFMLCYEASMLNF